MFSKIFNNKAKEDREFRMLVNEMKHQKFTNSSQVTEYKRKHHLSNKYQHISGVLTMQKGKDSWKYEGGISLNTTLAYVRN